MKKILFSIGISIFIGLISISNAHWADEQIKLLTENGVIETVFDENIENILKRPITREEFFSLVAVSNKDTGSEPIISFEDTGSEPISFEDFSDVNPKYALYIGELINDGIISGTPENGKLYIKPKAEITRREAAVILSKIFNLTDTEYELKFSDNNDIGAWAVPYIKGAVKANIISGYPDNTIRPKNNITIAETIALIGNSYSRGLFIEEFSVYAGTGESTLKDGDSLEASFMIPYGISVNGSKLYVADTGNNTIRCIEDGKVITIAGKDIGRNEYYEVLGSFKDGDDARFDKPTFITSVANGVLVTDQNNNLIRFVDENGYVTTFAGNLDAGLTSGTADKAKFNRPTGIAVDSKGNVYVSDTGNNVIRKIDTNKKVTTFAGKNVNGGYKDGPALEAEFNSPMGLFIKDDVLYVADSGNQRIRMIKDNIVTTVAGNSTEKDDFGFEYLGDFIDGDKKTAKFNFPVNLTLDNMGNIYVADNGNGCIRKIDLYGNVTTLRLDGLKRPAGLTILGNELFVSDILLNRIFRIKL